MQKNTAGKWIVFAFDRTDNTPVTGDALNITANVRIDGGAANAVDDTNPTELEDGYYIFDITAAEANGDNLLLTAESGTANVQVVACPPAVWTRPPNFEALGIEADGHAHADVKEWTGNAVTASSGNPDVNVESMDANVITATVVATGAIDADAIGTNAITAAKFGVGAITSVVLATDCITSLEIQDGALTAAKFAASSLDGKGDWNIGKTDYALSAAGVDAIWDETMAGHVTADTAGLVMNELQDGGRLDLLIDAIKAVTDLIPDAGALTTIDANVDAILADTGTDGVVISAATANKLADHVLRRTWANAEASSDGDTIAFRSLFGAVAKLVNRVAVSGATLTVYKDDDTTSLGTQSVTTDAAADPITEVNTT
jgi:hypothetical protein